MNKLRLSNKDKNDLITEIKNTITKISEYEDLGDIKKLLKPLDTSNIIKPTILIPADILQKMYALTELSETEISWHGLVKKDSKTNTYLIYDILVFPQINSATSTETEDKEYTKWLQNGDFYIFMIFNKKHEIYSIVYDYKQQVKFINKEITIKIINEKNDIYQWAKAEIEKKCRKNKTKTAKGRYSYVIPKPTPEQDKYKQEKNYYEKYSIENLDIDILYEKYFGGQNESQ